MSSGLQVLFILNHVMFSHYLFIPIKNTCLYCKDSKFVVLFQSDDSDIWDDTALIKAYDKAVASFKVTWDYCSMCEC